MREETFSYHELAANLAAKLEHPDFIDDLNQLTADTPLHYDARVAAWSASAADSRALRISMRSTSSVERSSRTCGALLREIQA
jgi:hypothetical protein